MTTIPTAATIESKYEDTSIMLAERRDMIVAR